jgi:hypothetical protein
MKTITFDLEKAKAVETAVCEVFQCGIHELIGYKDTPEKKVIVFILLNRFGYDKRVIGHHYQMSYLYVPTVVSEVENRMKNVCDFEIKINQVYEKILDNGGNADCFRKVS